MTVACHPMTRTALFGAALAFSLATWGQDSPTGAVPDPTGEWLVAKKVASIRIADCDGKLWGVVASEANPGIDSKNPDPKLRSRPTLGMPILLGMARSKINQWDGEIYNSEDGHTYSANISLLSANVLKVQGCFLGFLCGGENWTRVEGQALPYASAAAPARNANGQKRGQKVAVPDPNDEVCSSVLGPAWLPHQRRLK